MSKTISGILLATIFLLPTIAHSSMGDFFNRADLQTEIEIGAEIFGFEYEEPNFMKDEGVFGGIYGSLTYISQENKGFVDWADLFNGNNGINRFKFDGRFAYGQVDYTSVGTGSLDNIDDYIVEVRTTAGMDFPILEDARLTPFIGLGYRYLNDDTGGLLTTTGAAGYEREANYFYIPFGVEFFNDYSEDWAFGFSAEYDLFIAGKQKSHLEDVSSSLSTLDNDQEDGYGVRGSIRVVRKTDSVDYVFEPYFRYWHVDDSEISPITFSGVLVGFGLEPENKSKEYGIRLGLHF